MGCAFIKAAAAEKEDAPVCQSDRPGPRETSRRGRRSETLEGLGLLES